MGCLRPPCCSESVMGTPLGESLKGHAIVLITPSLLSFRLCRMTGSDLINPYIMMKQPVSARALRDPLPSQDSDEQNTPNSSNRYQRLTRRVLRNSSHATPEAPTTPSGVAPSVADVLEGNDVQVAVMVAMPSQRHISSNGIPDIAIGISQILVKTKP